MSKYRKILMAYDGSEASKNALDQAVKLALVSDGAQLTIIVVMQAPEVGVEVISINEAMGVLEAETGKLAEDAVARAKGAGLKARTVMGKGTPYMEITGLAEKEGFELIVTGRRGLSRLERVLMGSVTSRIISHTKKDVLVIPRESKLGFDSILVATDGSKNADMALERALDFAVDYNSNSLTAVSVVDVNAEIMALKPDAVEAMTRRYEKELELAVAETEATGLEARKSVVIGPVADSIVKTAGDTGANIIFMGTHGRTGMARFIMGSVTEKVIGHSMVPVLVTRGGSTEAAS